MLLIFIEVLKIKNIVQCNKNQILIKKNPLKINNGFKM